MEADKYIFADFRENKQFVVYVENSQKPDGFAGYGLHL